MARTTSRAPSPSTKPRSRATNEPRGPRHHDGGFGNLSQGSHHDVEPSHPRRSTLNAATMGTGYFPVFSAGSIQARARSKGDDLMPSSPPSSDTPPGHTHAAVDAPALIAKVASLQNLKEYAELNWSGS